MKVQLLEIQRSEAMHYSRSSRAGAHWRTSATPEQPMICDWDVQTFEYWMEVLDREGKEPHLPKSGLKVRTPLQKKRLNEVLQLYQMQDSYHFWDDEPNEDLWWAPHVKDFTQISGTLAPVSSTNERSPAQASKIRWAASCRAPSINVPQYLLYLQEKARVLGVKVIKARVPTDAGIEKALAVAESTARANGRPPADCFLNATGLGALKLCEDHKMFPIRGQTVLVRGEASATRTRTGEGYTAYCIPRPSSGMTILGGTKEKGNWSEEVHPETTKVILERNSYMVPELLTASDGGFEVVSVQCGLRPGREGGPRMEKQTIGGKKVVHAYGHSSGGYQNSVGSARLVVKMVTESVGGSSELARL